MRWLIALCLFWLSTPLRAEVAGQTAPAFVAAQDFWLSGDEAQSLPALAALAGQGNTAAQLLLGLIDTTPGLQGDWLMTQDRGTRIRVLRPEGGISGGNWLREAARIDPIAQSWLQLWQGQATPAVVLDFARLGEARAARVAALALAARQTQGFADVAGDADFPAVLQAYALLEQQKTDPARAETALATLDAGDPQRVVFGPMPPAKPLAAWLTQNPEGAPLVALCQTLCQGEAPEVCLPAGFAALGGYHALLRMGPVVQALTPPEVYNASPMGLTITLRRMQQNQVGLTTQAAATLGSTCLAARLK